MLIVYSLSPLQCNFHEGKNLCLHCSLVYSKTPEQCLAHKRPSINTGWTFTPFHPIISRLHPSSQFINVPHPTIPITEQLGLEINGDSISEKRRKEEGKRKVEKEVLNLSPTFWSPTIPTEVFACNLSKFSIPPKFCLDCFLSQIPSLNSQHSWVNWVIRQV